MRRAGGLGESEIVATQQPLSSRSACPGKSDAVCPSGPIPSTTQSSVGGAPGAVLTPERLEEVFALRAFYSRSADGPIFQPLESLR